MNIPNSPYWTLDVVCDGVGIGCVGGTIVCVGIGSVGGAAIECVGIGSAKDGILPPKNSSRAPIYYIIFVCV